VMAPRPEHRQEATGELEHIAPLERDRGTVRASPRPRPGCLGSADRDLCDGSSSRYSGSRHPPLGVRVWRAPAQRVARLRVEQLRDEPPAWLDPRDAKSPALPCLAIQLGRTKTGDADEEGRVLLVGPPVEALREWLERAGIKKGPIFRAIDRWEAVEEKALTPQSINLIVKRRCAMAGLEPEAFSAHGLRAGYLTEAARQGIALPEAMSSPSTARSSRPRATTMRPSARRAGRQGWGSKEIVS
jgi:integrase